MNSAGVALMSDDLRRLPFLVSLSRETTKVIWQNLIFGISFILVAEIAIIYKDGWTDDGGAFTYSLVDHLWCSTAPGWCAMGNTSKRIGLRWPAG